MHSYQITLYPALTKPEVSIADSLEIVLRVAEEYNMNVRRAINKKTIDTTSITVEKNAICFILESDTWLEFPTKAIRGFISMLSKCEPYSSLKTRSGRLFKGESQFIENAAQKKRDFSDEEALLEVTKLFFRQTEENRRKINDIKKILGGN